MNRIFFSIVVMLLSVFPFSAGAEELIRKGEALTVGMCLDIALGIHPDVMAARKRVEASLSRIGQAESSYYPQLNASAGYDRTAPLGVSNSHDQYSGSISLQQNLYDFGKTSAQVSIQNSYTESARADLEQTFAQTVFNVKKAYYGVLKAGRERGVAEETVKQFERHLEQAKGFFEVGTKPKFDVTKAEVDLSNAKLNMIRAGNSFKTSLVSLNNAIGLPSAPEYTIEDILSFQKYDITLEEAVDTAYKNRHDLKSAVAKRRALEESVGLAKKGYLPQLSGHASYTKAAESFPLDEGWNAGLTLSIPIFSGYLTKNQVEEAKANLAAAEAGLESVRQGIYLEVRQSHLNLYEAEERIAAAELIVRQATENLEIANGRYAAGVGNPIEVADAEVGLVNAKNAYIAALYDYRMARASLEKAMGIR